MARPVDGGSGIAAVAIIGGGWAGLAAAIELTAAGHAPLVLEAAPQFGGRARAIELRMNDAVYRVDNGQHLIVGAYHETLRLIGEIAGESGRVLRRESMRLASVGGLRISPPRWPAPWHTLAGLIAARGISPAQKFSIVRLMAGLRIRRWRVPPGATVADWLKDIGQSSALVAMLWEPLCVATLNTPIESACARTFANVLRDTLGAGRHDSDFMLPVETLAEVFPIPAERWLRAHGAVLRPRCLVSDAIPGATDWSLTTPDGPLRARRLIVATPPVNAARLLANAMPARALSPLRRFEYEPIATVYLIWPAAESVALPAWIMLSEDAKRQWHGQWLFDRGVTNGHRLGAVVISARGRALLASGEPAGEALGAAIAAQLGDQLGLPAPVAVGVVVDKRATFRCGPARPQLRGDAFASIVPHLWLAGDYCWPDYPATLEAAVRSGVAAARMCVADQGP
jgi:hydroxysqualene dehydroxylase